MSLMSGHFWKNRSLGRRTKWTSLPTPCSPDQFLSMRSLIFFHSQEYFNLDKSRKLSLSIMPREEFFIELLLYVMLREALTTKSNWKVTLLWLVEKWVKNNLTLESKSSVNGTLKKFSLKTQEKWPFSSKLTLKVWRENLFLKWFQCKEKYLEGKSTR